tara:strand:- start:50059 stop:50361 length:303 start_codon:yes stop_codon:yes gene_type:complete
LFDLTNGHIRSLEQDIRVNVRALRINADLETGEDLNMLVTKSDRTGKSIDRTTSRNYWKCWKVQPEVTLREMTALPRLRKQLEQPASLKAEGSINSDDQV